MRSLVALALLGACALPARAQERGAKLDDARLEEALRGVATWLERCSIERDGGLAWPRVPGAREKVDPHLYAGVAGVVLFHLELAHLTGEKVYLERARRGARFLLACVPEKLGTFGAGLYHGVGGLGFALCETWRASGEEVFREGAERCVKLIADSAEEVAGGGATWGRCTDIISGAAGTGLFLLYAAEPLESEPALALARRAGRGLVAAARKGEEGWWWPLRPEYPREMPNFSHGTAGVCTFLARLHQRSEEPEFLEAARRGGEYLLALAGDTSDGFRLCHHRPGGEELFYMGWCHGPPGTARLFAGLHAITGEERWKDACSACAATILREVRAGTRLPGLWNNAGQCCGTAGVAEFLLSMYRTSGDPALLRRCEELTGDLLERGVCDDEGLRWPGAEHRVRPALIESQTGHMQGAAGIGLWLARLLEFRRGRAPRIRLPDDPFQR